MRRRRRRRERARPRTPWNLARRQPADDGEGRAPPLAAKFANDVPRHRRRRRFDLARHRDNGCGGGRRRQDAPLCCHRRRRSACSRRRYDRPTAPAAAAAAANGVSESEVTAAGEVRPFGRTGLAFRKLNSRTAAARSSVWGLRRADGRAGGGDAAAADRFANGLREGGRDVRVE